MHRYVSSENATPRVSGLFLVVLMAVGGCKNSPTSPPPPPPPPPPALTITSVSSTSPTPLTPLQINTSGLTQSTPVSVRFSSNSGFQATENPVRLGSDGTIIAGVPIYVNPSNGAIEQGTVSIVVVQGNQSSAPITLTFQDLPGVGAYGTQPGQISHAVLVFDAMLISRRINELEAFQLLPSNTVDATQSITALQTLLNAIIEARSDVDRVMQDSTVVVSGGIISNGMTIQFDKSSLDNMDRVTAVFLMQTLAPLDLSSSQVTEISQSHVLRSPVATLQSPISTLLSDLETSGRVSGIEDKALKAQASCTTSAYSGQCVIDATAVLATVAKEYATDVEALGPNTALGENGARMLGTVGAVIADMDVIGHVFGDLAGVINGATSGDAAVLNSAVNDLHSIPLQETGGAFIDLVSAPVFVELKAIQPVATGASTLLSLFSIDDALQGQLDIAHTTTVNLADLVRVPSTNTQGIGSITGNVSISNSQGFAAAQTGLDLCCFGASALGITDLADPNGDYVVYVPLQATGTNYSSLTIGAFDPVGSLQLTSELVDLTGLTISTPVQVPAMQGTCNDPDASTPDADDPDCD